MANRQKRKGDYVERRVVHLLLGIPKVSAWRIPLGEQAAPDGSGTGDILMEVPGLLSRLRGEVKSRKGGAGFKTLETWLGTNDVLFLHRNGQQPMVVMPWGTFQQLAGERWLVLPTESIDQVPEPFRPSGTGDGSPVPSSPSIPRPRLLPISAGYRG